MTLKSVLKDKSGGSAFYTDLLVGIVIFLIVVALVMSVLPVYTQKNLIDGLADDMARYIELVGQAQDEDVKARTKSLATTYGLNPDAVQIEVQATYYNNTAKTIQIMDPFTVTITYQTQFGISEYAIVPITLTGKAVGRSEVYWK